MSFFCTLRAAPKCKGDWGIFEYPPEPGGLCYACHYFTADLEQAAIKRFGMDDAERVFRPDVQDDADERNDGLGWMRRDVRAAAARAEALRLQVVDVKPFGRSGKATASDDVETVSGYSPFGDVAFAKPEKVRDLAKKIGHRLRPSRRDQLRNGGWPGRYSACHAEKQLALLTSDTVLAVSQDMCDDCHAFFGKLARKYKQTYIVGEPGLIHVFLPDGSAYTVKDQ